MPLFIPLLAAALAGRATKKPKKKIAVSGRLKKDGTRSKAHLRRAK
jgi:hypothetical protein